MNLPPTATALVVALTACTPAPTPRPPAAVRGSVRIETLHAAVASHSGVDALLYAGPHPYDRAALALVDDIAQWGKTMGREGEWARLLFGPDLAAWRDRDPAALATKLAPGQLAIYLDCGTEDDPVLLDGARYLDDVLTTHQLAHTAYFGPGRHDYAFWSVRARASLAFLRAHTAPPTP